MNIALTEQKTQFIHKIVKLIGEVLFFAMLAATFSKYMTICYVDGSSMEQTLHSGQLTIIKNGNDNIQDGDIVAVVSDGHFYADYVIKRIVATSGDTIEMKHGILFRNGKKVSEPYAQKGKDSFDPITVPKGKIFVMGDNREVSIDSRKVGLLLQKDVIGKVVFPWKK